MALPEMIGGKYRPRAILGKGASGTVYSVEHMFTGELLALKAMRSNPGSSAEAIARFKREARAVSQIKSQHVVRIFDADVAQELGGVPYLVMDLLEGRDLEQIAGHTPVPGETVVEWLRQVAVPLDKAHRLGIVHRDLKPENLFLTRRDDGGPLIKILDFGIAKMTAESTGTTQCGQLFGTPLYMAPEQARGEPAQIGGPTDLYAMGLIAFRLLTGSPYRTGATLTAILNEILNQPLRLPSHADGALTPEFDEWFLRACQADPARRFGSADEQVEALARALKVPVSVEGGAGPPSSVRPREIAARDIGHSQPDSSGNAPVSVRAALVPVRADPARGGQPMADPSRRDSVKEGTGAVGRALPIAALGVFALIAVLLLAVLVGREARPGAGAAASGGSVACPTDTHAAVFAASALAAVPAMDTAAPGRSMAGDPAPNADTAAPPPQRDVPAAARVPPARGSTSRAAPTRTKAALIDDDPLSDQQ